MHDQRHVAWKRGRWPDAPAQYQQPFSRVQLLPARLDQPLRWSKPRRVFVNSLSDLFHDDVPDDFIRHVVGVILAAERHTFQVLTKRPERMRRFFAQATPHECWRTIYGRLGDRLPESRYETFGKDYIDGLAWPLPNLWLGVSVEDQQRADERIPLLIQTPAAVRFLSCEPLLGPVDLLRWLLDVDKDGDPIGPTLRPDRLDWVIVGGESGPHARPMHPGWARDLVDQCQACGVATFFKQWGEHLPADQGGQRFIERSIAAPDGGLHVRHRFADDTVAWRVGKKAAGRVLDGRTWDEFPTAAVPA